MISLLVYFDLGLEDKDLFLTWTTNNIPDAHLSLSRFIFSTLLSFLTLLSVLKLCCI